MPPPPPPAIGAQASRLARDLTLNSPSSAKTTIPKLVYGTAWKKDRTADLVYTALKNGFRGIDTAAQPKHYDEEAVGRGVGRAIADGLVSRQDVYIQTKFTAPAGQSSVAPYDLDAPLVDKVHQSVQSSLRNFTFGAQEPYVDNLVMHSPLDSLEDTVTVWKALEAYTPHAIRNLGISNVSLPVLVALVQAVDVKPTVVQNRFHDLTAFEVDLRDFCRDSGIVFQSFWTLSANPGLARSPPAVRVAQEARVALPAAYYSLVLGLEGLVVLDGTTSETHMVQDLQGVEAVGSWAEANGEAVWAAALNEFKGLIGQP